jgi:hypothetical protein
MIEKRLILVCRATRRRGHCWGLHGQSSHQLGIVKSHARAISRLAAPHSGRRATSASSCAIRAARTSDGTLTFGRPMCARLGFRVTEPLGQCSTARANGGYLSLLADLAGRHKSRVGAFASLWAIIEGRRWQGERGDPKATSPGSQVGPNPMFANQRRAIDPMIEEWASPTPGRAMNETIPRQRRRPAAAAADHRGAHGGRHFHGSRSTHHLGQ